MTRLLGILPQDLVALQFVIHECPPAAIGALVAEAHRLLRPGGVLLLSDNDPRCCTTEGIAYCQLTVSPASQQPRLRHCMARSQQRRRQRCSQPVLPCKLCVSALQRQVDELKCVFDIGVATPNAPALPCACQVEGHPDPAAGDLHADEEHRAAQRRLLHLRRRGGFSLVFYF